MANLISSRFGETLPLQWQYLGQWMIQSMQIPQHGTLCTAITREHLLRTTYGKGPLLSPFIKLISFLEQLHKRDAINTILQMWHLKTARVSY